MSRHATKTATMAATLEAKTGRSLDAWLEHLSAQGPKAPTQWHAWLKAQGLGHFQARLVVAEARKRAETL
jgi:hypothetical protein